MKTTGLSPNKVETKRRVLVYLILILIVLVSLIFTLINVIPATNLTRTRMVGIERRIRLFVEREQRLPVSLEELPQSVNSENSIEDGWGERILYEHGAESAVALRSFGKDKRKGGTGEATDIEHSFSVGKELHR